MKTPRQPEDPILSPQEMAQDAGINLATWRRNYRDNLPITSDLAAPNWCPQVGLAAGARPARQAAGMTRHGRKCQRPAGTGRGGMLG
jgi:hypothetical protein